ncbi:MAG TPA: hypothetical protein VF618_13955 [Thermoanaerobaculia bacterium]
MTKRAFSVFRFPFSVLRSAASAPDETPSTDNGPRTTENAFSRRTFARLAAAIAALPAALPSALLAQEVPQQPQLSTEAQAEVEARISWILGKYGARLDDAQRADIRRLVSGAQGGFEQFRAFPLDNAVEPATPFRVWRAAPPRRLVKRVDGKEKS